MFKKFGLQILTVAIIFALTGAQSFAQKRVRFKSGSNSAVVSGTLGKNVSRVFIVSGRAGQEFSATVKTKGKKIFVYPEGDELGEWGIGFSQTLEADGDFRFVLENQGNAAAAYTMTVTVK